MKFLKSVQLAFCVAIYFLNADVFGSEHKHPDSEQFNATVYPRGHEFQHTIVTRQPDGTTTRVINKKYLHPIVKYDGKLYQVGKEITGREQETRTVSREVCCCGCKVENGGLADLVPCCILCTIVRECCGCVRTVEYQVPVEQMER